MVFDDNTNTVFYIYCRIYHTFQHIGQASDNSPFLPPLPTGPFTSDALISGFIKFHRSMWCLAHYRRPTVV